jgi:NAD(P)-dependent dehydrogenase (short-subunit alcohol dehydrogenase family)
MERFPDLRRKVVIVTGGSQGIGLALSQGFAESGCEVVIVNRRPEEGEAAVQAIQDSGGSAISIPADVSQEESVKAMVEGTLQRHGRLDVLVNNAGTAVRKPVLECSVEEFEMMFDINLKGLFLCCKAVGQEMIKQGGGKIVNMSSIAANFALMNRGQYSTTKAGVTQLTRNLAVEWAQYGVRVNAIGPGIIQTPMTEAYIRNNPEKSAKTLQKIPLRRFGKPEDLVGVALFLASNASDYMTGQTLYVDGGYTLGCMDW